MPDMNAIATALAGRFAAAQVTAPVGEDNIRSSSAALPDQLPATPCVLVFYDRSAYRTGNGTRLATHTFLVRFYQSETLDLERLTVRLTKWATVLADQLRVATQLGGTANVARATVDDLRLGILRYAKQDYSGIELTCTIVTTEGWSASA